MSNTPTHDDGNLNTINSSNDSQNNNNTNKYHCTVSYTRLLGLKLSKR